ncbi:hypothetical protein [Pseudomonas moorei]|jgi:hypothetical protein|nr:hypothetical protein [Pseudomonas moorei]
MKGNISTFSRFTVDARRRAAVVDAVSPASGRDEAAGQAKGRIGAALAR